MLTVLATLLAVMATLAVWVDRLLLDPNAWSAMSTQLLRDPTIRDATARYIVDQIPDSLNPVAPLSSALPGPLGRLINRVRLPRSAELRGARAALGDRHVQALWAQTNLRAAQAFVVIVEGGREPAGVQHGQVTLDLAPVARDITSRIGIPRRVAAKLPASRRVKILRSRQLALVQELGQGLRGLATALPIAALMLYLIAVGLARGRRRKAVVRVGVGMVIAGLFVVLARWIAEQEIPASLVTYATVRPAASAVVSIATSMLVKIAAGLVAVGTALAAGGWVAAHRTRHRPT